jgi:hypothetical protein
VFVVVYIYVYINIFSILIYKYCSVKQFKDIACINLSPTNLKTTKSDFVLIGMWTKPTIQILQLPHLNPILDHALNSVSGPKDILLIKLENVNYLMVLLGITQL